MPERGDMCMIIKPLAALPADLSFLEAESIAQGFSMIRRLREDWETGQNRFDGPGEVLLGAFADERLVGVGGLNIDPYLADPGVGRLRHLYVLQARRRSSVGSRLVGGLLSHAAGRFGRVRLWTGQAGAFYEALGFARTDEEKATHVIAPPAARAADAVPSHR